MTGGCGIGFAGSGIGFGGTGAGIGFGITFFGCINTGELCCCGFDPGGISTFVSILALSVAVIPLLLSRILFGLSIVKPPAVSIEDMVDSTWSVLVGCSRAERS